MFWFIKTGVLVTNGGFGINIFDERGFWAYERMFWYILTGVLVYFNGDFGKLFLPKHPLFEKTGILVT